LQSAVEFKETALDPNAQAATQVRFSFFGFSKPSLIRAENMQLELLVEF
jgi:hypothetical protein